jgi:O-antigen ligase
VALMLATALVAWLGGGRALDRFTSYGQLEVNESRRIEMSKDSLRIFFDHPIVGTGLGTLEKVFPRYETLYDGKIVNHSHNDYVEALAETGLIGGALCAVFLVLLFCESWARLVAANNTLDLALHIGALAACCGLLIHSLVDFNLHIPSNALLFLLQAGLATSRTPSNRPAARFPRHAGDSPLVVIQEPV